jgi:hypothetical protein
MIMLDQSGVRDRYQQFAVMARELLADFRHGLPDRQPRLLASDLAFRDDCSLSPSP